MALDEFISRSQRQRPQAQEYYRKYFEDVVRSPYNCDKELLLQAFLFFNIKEYFPLCTDILLFENSPDCLGNTHLGKCDFVYLTNQDSIFLIETKFIDTQTTGKTARKRRNTHRNKVREQVTNLREQFKKHWDIPREQIKCGVFTTDPQLTYPGFSLNIALNSISISRLEEWQKNKLDEDIDIYDNQRILDLVWDYAFGCEVCWDTESCKRLGFCYLDLSDD
jgi:hypothetical protein